MGFQPRLARRAPPFTVPYAALHVRHGDKGREARLLSLESLMAALKERWPGMRHVFIATDDASVLTESALRPYRETGFIFNWTEEEQRWAGGSPDTQDDALWYHHHNRSRDVAAVLDDILG